MCWIPQSQIFSIMFFWESSLLAIKGVQGIYYLCLTLVLDIHVIDNWQMSKNVSADQCHVTVFQAQVYNS